MMSGVGFSANCPSGMYWYLFGCCAGKFGSQLLESLGTIAKVCGPGGVFAVRVPCIAKMPMMSSCGSLPIEYCDVFATVAPGMLVFSHCDCWQNSRKARM